MRQSLLISFFLLVVSGASAQVMGNYAVQQRAQGNSPTTSNVNLNVQYRAVPKAADVLGNNIMEFTINALSNQKADSYTAIFSILQFGKTAEQTNAGINGRIDAFKQKLIAQGIKISDIYVDMVNFLPKYEFEESKKIFSKSTYIEVPTGFEVQKNVHIRYRDPGMLDNIITAAASQEIYDIVKVDYFLNQPQNVYQELRQTAFDYLANLKAQYRKSGIALDTAYVISGENAWVAYPTNRYEGYQAFTSQQLPGSVSADKISKADKPYAQFYNAIPANDYDIVINSDILEPAIQFSYNLRIRFTLAERIMPTKTVTQKQVLILTADGKLIPVGE